MRTDTTTTTESQVRESVKKFCPPPHTPTFRTFKSLGFTGFYIYGRPYSLCRHKFVFYSFHNKVPLLLKMPYLGTKKFFLISGDWDSLDQDIYGYSSGGYDRIKPVWSTPDLNPVWSTPELKPVWSTPEMKPVWSSPDTSFRQGRQGREVLVNPWFPNQVICHLLV